METKKFLDFLYDGLDGYALAARKGPNLRPDDRYEFEQKFFEWPAQRESMEAWIANNSPVSEVYICPSMLSKPNGTRAGFKASNVVWVEFDGNAPQIDTAYEHSPTMQVMSSATSHRHVYWKLGSPVKEWATLEAINHNLALSLGADPSGFECVQLLRPVGTVNHGLGKERKPMDVKLINQIDLSYKLEHFNVTIQPPAIDEAAVEFASLPDVTDLILQYAWTPQAIRLMKQDKPKDRSDALMSLAYEAAEMGCTNVEVFALIKHCDNRWGKFKDREDGDSKLAQIVRIARNKYPLGGTDDAFGGDYPLIFGYKDFLASDIQVEWVIPGMLMEQGYMLLAGPSGIGKTQLSLRWAMHLALGKPYLGYDIPTPRKMMMLSLEMGAPDLKFFVREMNKTLNDEERDRLQENLIIVPTGEPWHMDKEAGQAALVQLIEAYQPDGLMVDSVGSAISGDIASEGPVKTLMGFNDHIIRKYDMFTWWVHHMRKATGDNKKPQQQSDVYGNQYLMNRASTSYGVFKGDGPNKILIRNLKMRLAPMEKDYQIERIDHLDFKKVTEVSLKAATAEPIIIKHTQPDYQSPGGLHL